MLRFSYMLTVKLLTLIMICLYQVTNTGLLMSHHMAELT